MGRIGAGANKRFASSPREEARDKPLFRSGSSHVKGPEGKGGSTLSNKVERQGSKNSEGRKV